MKKITLLVVVSGMALSLPARTEGATLVNVTSTVAFDGGSGLYEYEYLLENPTANIFDGFPDMMFNFGIDVLPTADLSAIIAPTGWGYGYTAGATEIQWIASGPTSPLSPGGSATFGFSSRLSPVDQDYQVAAITDSGVRFLTGIAQGPGGSSDPVVPEPSTFAIWGVLGGLVLSAARRKEVA